MSPQARAGNADPLVVRHIEFLGGMAGAPGTSGTRPWRPLSELPEVAFAGRSNVGKSALLNALVRRKGVARVSRTPGRTREVNFFEVNGEFILVDLPGYGYARASKTERAAWCPLIERYLRDTPTLRGLVMLLDVRRDPTPNDETMLAFLAERGLPVLIVVTKVDKLKPRDIDSRVAAITTALGLAPEQVVPFSAVTGRGRDELAAAVVELVRA